MSAATQSGSDRRSLARSKKPPEYVRLVTRAPVLMRRTGAHSSLPRPRRLSGHRQFALAKTPAEASVRSGRPAARGQINLAGSRTGERFGTVFEDDQLMAVALSFQWIVLMGRRL